jgi:hypothetical protein
VAAVKEQRRAAGRTLRRRGEPPAGFLASWRTCGRVLDKPFSAIGRAPLKGEAVHGWEVFGAAGWR